MNTNHYPTLELCKKLKDIGFPKTECVYFQVDDNGYEDDISKQKWIPHDFCEYGNTMICPSVMEILDVIPEYIKHDEKNSVGGGEICHLIIRKSAGFGGYDILYESSNKDYRTVVHMRNTLPNALAEMTLWLHENNYISFNK